MGIRPLFYQFLYSDFMTTLQVPADFMKHFKVLPTKCILWSHVGGRVRAVEMVSFNGSLFFGEGLKEFAEDNFLEEGDLLLFRYDGGTVFDVEVFGKNRCEKTKVVRKSTPAVPNEGGNAKEPDDDDYIFVSSEKKMRKETSPQMFSRRTNSWNSKRIIEEESDDDSLSKEAFPVFSHEKRMRKDSSPHIFSSKGQFSSQGLCSAGAKDRPSNSGTPSFNVTILLSYKGGTKRAYLPVPRNFVATSLSLEEEDGDEDNFIFLEKEGSRRKWCVKYCAKSRQLGEGWSNFVRDNQLEVNDVCNFQVVKDMANTLKVSIYRK